MPSFQDGALIFFLALLLFGPKKLPELARYVGKLMAEFRRASSEFRMQMEDEFRMVEQAEQQKKIAAMEAAAPVTPPIEPEPSAEVSPEFSPESTAQSIPEPEHPHMPPPEPISAEPAAEPLPIASHGDLHLMPPATGLPVARSESLSGVFDSIPQASEAPSEPEAPTHA